MKRWLVVALSLLLMLQMLPVGIFTFEVSAATEGQYTYMVSNGEATITDVDTSIGEDVVVPSAFDGYPVTGIGAYAFEECKNLNSVALPDGVVSIGDYAFYGCSNLCWVKIPNSVTTIGDSAFAGCYNLTPVIPDGVISIGAYAFAQCYSIASITIPNSVTSIGSRAFYECYDLASISVPDRVTGIGEEAFRDTGWYNNQPDGLIYVGKVVYTYKGTCPSSVTIKEGTRGIADGAFYNCDNLTSVAIPDGVTGIGDRAFYACDNLTSITIPDSVSDIGNSPLDYTPWYETLYNNQPDGLIYVGKAVYTYKGTCPSSVTIKEGTRGIADYAFHACDSLTSITIPDSMTNIGYFAFAHCTGLSDVWYGGFEKDKAQIFIDTNNDPLLNATWHCTKCTSHIYDNACDADCNECGETRTVTHNYQWIVDRYENCGVNGLKHEECSVCHATRNANTSIPATGNHTYDNDQDATCNECGDVREVQSSNSATLTVQSSTVLVGKQVEITVLLANNPGFMYLELTPVFPADWHVTAQNGTLISDMTQGKQLVWVADEDMTENGVLLTLAVTIPENAQPGDYNIGFTVRGCYNYDEEDVAVNVESGTVTVFDFVYGDATGDGAVDGRDVTRLKKYLANYDYDTDTSSVEIGFGADATGDGVVDGRDVTRLKKYLANYDYDTDSSTTVLGPQ